MTAPSWHDAPIYHEAKLTPAPYYVVKLDHIHLTTYAIGTHEDLSRRVADLYMDFRSEGYVGHRAAWGFWFTDGATVVAYIIIYTTMASGGGDRVSRTVVCVSVPEPDEIHDEVDSEEEAYQARKAAHEFMYDGR
jgi:hypothetical protein